MRVKTLTIPLQTSIILFITTILLLFPTHHQAKNNLPISASGAAILPPLQDLLVFADQRLAAVYPVIQRFKDSITSDTPFNVTATWTGSKGFFCDTPPDNRSATTVASIDFNGFHISSPTLVGFLDELPDLALFHANSNYFSGAFASSITALPTSTSSTSATTASRAHSPLPSLPWTVQFLHGSRTARAIHHGPRPPLPEQQHFMTRLPDNADADAHVAYLNLANNKFFGPIPRSIAKALSGLSEILLLNNLLSGCLPYELGLLKDAVVFDVGGNDLTGPLPFSLGCLDKLEVLNLAGNKLYGQVPEPLCLLANLRNVSLSGNYFMG
ncbi:uncharacterized protein At4g06744-like [Salvia splendens]|uniref:uncharacterized protein At4g06744-like n=1 Tax=Salvia splendens TaxID=180675 RepID=UPI001C25B3CF|nr:uncharacterized protein At4g06744-like [Salvia splendens]